MATTDARLSANLQRTYTAYRTQGKTPVTLGNLQSSQNVRHSTRSPRAPHLPAMIQELGEEPEMPFEPKVLTLPEIARPQSVQLPPLARYERLNTSQRLTQSQDMQAYGNDTITYEYQLDDAAGIPSLGFFKKPYSLPTNRYGRVGACWRHIKQCTVQGGSNFLFVDGGIKETDCNKYPPFGIIKSKVLINSLGQRLVPREKSSNTPSNDRAKGGFEYWYKESKANAKGPPAAPVRTISGHQYKIKGR